MNKADLMENLRRETGLNKDKAEQIVDIFFQEMSDALSNGGRVEIRGFCSFYVKNYKPYIGRNPKTGERVQVAPKKLPFFKCGKELKSRVDNNVAG
jgi:integration host factor subunit beta